MKKLVLFFLFIFLSASSAHAKTSILDDLLKLPLDTTDSLGTTIFSLGEIKVDSGRVSSGGADPSATSLAHNVTVIGPKKIAEAPFFETAAILSTQEGVNATDDLGLGAGARVDLRGFGGESKNALVLFDGIRAVEPFDNSVAWSLYPAEYLDSITVQRGGGSTVYGEGAFSGVIGLKTKRPTKEFKLKTENSWGMYNSERYFAETSGTNGPLGFYFSGRYYSTAGYRQNADEESSSGLLKTEYELSDRVRVDNAFYVADNKTGIAGPLLAPEVEQDRLQKDPDGQFGDGFFDRVIQNGSTLHWTIEPLGAELTDQFGYRLRDQNSDQSFGGSFPGRSVNRIGTETLSNVVQVDWKSNVAFVDNQMTGGFEWSIDDIHNPFTFIDLTFGPFSSERSIDRRMIGFFWQDRVTLWERLILEPGVRWDKINWDIYDLRSPQLEKHKKTDHVSPKIGAELKLADAVSVYGNYSEAFKAPDANTLIFETPNLFSPNPNIDPQTAHHYELGARYAHPKYGSLRADWFVIDTKKEIFFNDITNLNENFDTQRQGAEAAGEIAVTPELQFFASYTYTDAEFDNGVFDGKAVPLTPRHKWTAGFNLKVLEHLKLTGQAAGVYDQFALNDFNNRFPAEDYWTADAGIAYTRDNWELFVRAHNILNERYSSFATSNGVDVVNFNPAPGTYLEAGFKFES